MDNVYFNVTKENNQVTEAADDSLNTSLKESPQLFNPAILIKCHWKRWKRQKEKTSDFHAIHDYIMKNKASNADKTY